MACTAVRGFLPARLRSLVREQPVLRIDPRLSSRLLRAPGYFPSARIWALREGRSGICPRARGRWPGEAYYQLDSYDRHYGPLFDGTAFSASRRGPRPIPFAYLPINPEWPASYEFWGERGYEAEFVNVVSEMERHFREKGWTDTNFEVFFNHKKR